MTTSPKRPGGDSLGRLEEMRAAYERLRAERIRAEGEVERLGRELDQARARAREAFGTDDEAELQRLIEAAMSENAKRVEDFEAILGEVETRLRQLGSEP
ncbi:hypothetical protein [Microvirga thermotolerans]|uniref:Uncharacterized protein n=1 Tax=Microvirga thermotolerans TaxID=2651334 RepID=A0A5P9JSZ2_9HYPH|nr:hypothetical protein [Microvirga thermotolerans]QFU15533.1 hypothetical protein GDR74_04510 [Microvirga thermotolerans]